MWEKASNEILILKKDSNKKYLPINFHVCLYRAPGYTDRIGTKKSPCDHVTNGIFRQLQSTFFQYSTLKGKHHAKIIITRKL